MTDEIHVVVIEHRYGVDVFAFRNERDLDKFLLSWAEDWWDEEFDDGEERPDNSQDLMDQYFERALDRGESYTTHRVTVQ